MQYGGAWLGLLFLLNCEATTAQQNPPAAYAEISSQSTTVPPPEPKIADSSDIYADAEMPTAAESPPTDSVTTDEVVHRAELRGRVETQAGKRLTIEPLVVTSSTFPVPGCTANLWIAVTNSDGDLDWRHFADVRVANQIRFGEPVELDIIEIEKSAQTNDAATMPLPRGSRVRIQWEW